MNISMHNEIGNFECLVTNERQSWRIFAPMEISTPRHNRTSLFSLKYRVLFIFPFVDGGQSGTHSWKLNDSKQKRLQCLFAFFLPAFIKKNPFHILKKRGKENLTYFESIMRFSTEMVFTEEMEAEWILFIQRENYCPKMKVVTCFFRRIMDYRSPLKGVGRDIRSFSAPTEINISIELFV
jgi:hypothetical protein